MDFMPTNEKEYNGNLFDQLTLLDDIEDALKEGGKDKALKEIERKRSQINRKLYQAPPLTDNRTEQ